MTTTTTTIEKFRGQFGTAPEAAKAITAGNAVITLVSKKTSARYTYRIRKADPKPGQKPVWFVSLLTGPSNEADYTYIGLVDANGFRTTAKSKIAPDAAPTRGFGWAVARLSAGRFPETLEVWHEGRCCRCGRRLTVPSSIANGLGPECAANLGGGR